MDNTHEWCATGIKPQIENLKDLSVDAFPSWMEKLRRFESIYIPSVDELPAEADPEKAILESQDIKSLIALPLLSGRSLMGFIRFDFVREKKIFGEDVIKPLGMVVEIIVNALERKRSEEARIFLEAVFEQTAESIIITDLEGSIRYANLAFEQITGYSKEEVLGENPRILKSGKQGDDFYQNLWDTIKGGSVWKGRFINKKKDGTLYNEEATISPVRDATGKISNFVAVKRDITQELNIENQLLHAQKMESIGLLAGGVAHDFNNILTAIMGYSSLINRKKELPEEIRRMIEEIEKASLIGAELTGQLLTFSRKQPTKLEVINLNAIINHAIRFLGRILGPTIQIELALEKDLELIEADISQLHQVLMNLSINARDAMPKGGKIFLKTSNINIEQKYIIDHRYAKQGPHVLLSFTDTGIGMDKKTLAKIFEPFFTTKELGKGTGLGLSIVYGIIKNHKGIINAYSELSQGTTFKIYFPQTKSKEKKQPEEQILVLGGNETILLVDDDEAVLNLACGVLEEYGYKCLTAENGEKALEIYGQDYKNIQLVLVDVVMPKMSGPELFKEIKKLNPRAKVILSSGFTLSGEKDLLEQGVKAFIPKPYQESFLARTIRKVLDEEKNKASRDDGEIKRPIHTGH
jgi:PAS domain S-box-containing protein